METTARSTRGRRARHAHGLRRTPPEPQIAEFVLDPLPIPPKSSLESLGRYSYTSLKMGLAARCRELFSLARVSIRSQTPGARHTVETVRRAERMILDATGKRVEQSNVLEIGPGQQLRHLRCFGTKNTVTGIDMDPIPQTVDAFEIARMLRHSPLLRTVKTLGRMALFQDARFKAALGRELGVRRFPRLRILQMDAKSMTFGDESFDLVFSCSVFEHIDDPRAALAEVARVLRPGGVAFISVHLYTSHSGQHDPRIFSQGKPVAPFWPHLRQAFAHTVQSSAFLNRLSLREWRGLFGATMPGVQFSSEHDEVDLREPLSCVRAGGELTEFSDDELLTVNLIAIWKKPPSATAVRPATPDSIERGTSCRAASA